MVNDLPSLSLTTKLYPNRVRVPSSLSRTSLTALLQCLGVRKDPILLGLTYWEPREPS